MSKTVMQEIKEWWQENILDEEDFIARAGMLLLVSMVAVIAFFFLLFAAMVALKLWPLTLVGLAIVMVAYFIGPRKS